MCSACIYPKELIIVLVRHQAEDKALVMAKEEDYDSLSGYSRTREKAASSCGSVSLPYDFPPAAS